MRKNSSYLVCGLQDCLCQRCLAMCGICAIYGIATPPAHSTPPGLNGVTGLVATPSGNTALLKWNAVAYANGYLVYVNQTSTGASYIVTTSSVTHTVAITCGLPYTFAVQAYSDGGYSDVSPPVKLNSCETSCELCAHPQPHPPPPTQPTHPCTPPPPPHPPPPL